VLAPSALALPRSPVGPAVDRRSLGRVHPDSLNQPVFIESIPV
jgi:hypothetical protein